jgi:RNA polymerase sigma-70 factor (ECF subfamily)
MSQEELLVLIYKKDETFTHLYDMYSKSLFSVIEF